MRAPELTQKEKTEVISLVDDLYWDWDRISTSGQESLDKISTILKMYNHVDRQEEE